jgi:hypothetical protein
MKKLTVLLFCFFLLNISCRKPENSPAPSSVISGKKWRLISYNLNGLEILSGFSNCTVAFNSNSELVITNNGINNTGTWKEFSNPPKIEMNISSNDAYVILFNKTWEAILLNPGRVELADTKINPQEIIKLDIIP